MQYLLYQSTNERYKVFVLQVKREESAKRVSVYSEWFGSNYCVDIYFGLMLEYCSVRRANIGKNHLCEIPETKVFLLSGSLKNVCR